MNAALKMLPPTPCASMKAHSHAKRGHLRLAEPEVGSWPASDAGAHASHDVLEEAGLQAADDMGFGGADASLAPGCSPWFDAAFRAHSRFVWRLASKLLPSANDADDIVQDVFCVFSMKGAQVPKAAQKAWLAAATVRVAKRHLRRPWVRWMRTAVDIDLVHSPGASDNGSLDGARTGGFSGAVRDGSGSGPEGALEVPLSSSRRRRVSRPSSPAFGAPARTGPHRVFVTLCGRLQPG